MSWAAGLIESGAERGVFFDAAAVVAPAPHFPWRNFPAALRPRVGYLPYAIIPDLATCQCRSLRPFNFLIFLWRLSAWIQLRRT